MKKIKINKKREKFNRAKKLTLCVATPVYIGLFVLLAAICAILSACNVFTADEMEIIAAAAVASYLIAATPLYVLYAWFLRKREACGCLENYDFSPVEITDSEEFCGQFSLVYHYLPDPFDSDEEVTLYGGKAIEIYAEQFADRLISLDEGDDPPFFINAAVTFGAAVPRGALFYGEPRRRTEIEFTGSGEWKSIDCRYSAVPEAVMPANIVAYVKQNFPNVHITKIEKDGRYYEVELSNRLDLYFDHNGNYAGFDD